MFGDYIVVLAQVGIIFSPEVEESSFDEEWFLVRILELVPIDTRNIDGYHHFNMLIKAKIKSLNVYTT